MSGGGTVGGSEKYFRFVDKKGQRLSDEVLKSMSEQKKMPGDPDVIMTEKEAPTEAAAEKESPSVTTKHKEMPNDKTSVEASLLEQNVDSNEIEDSVKKKTSEKKQSSQERASVTNTEKEASSKSEKPGTDANVAGKKRPRDEGSNDASLQEAIDQQQVVVRYPLTGKEVVHASFAEASTATKTSRKVIRTGMYLAVKNMEPLAICHSRPSFSSGWIPL